MRTDPLNGRSDPDDDWDGEGHDRGQAGPQPSDPPFGNTEPQAPPELSAGCCPACRSPRIQPRHLARRVASVVGTVAGVTTGVVRALQAAELAASGTAALALRAAGGPVLGTVASAVAAALIEGATGCALGVRLGEAVDRVILPNYRCTACGHRFGAPLDTA